MSSIVSLEGALYMLHKDGTLYRADKDANQTQVGEGDWRDMRPGAALNLRWEAKLRSRRRGPRTR